ncbi:MAG: MFS transporter [Bdellovibrio sp. CG12_big_fil_rev_8_21_14_0_65_39_13]|nr:MAG: MFS transporter [Bdellovibrio sp. CG22_combo_CG10-13_8_21_14_all_39_27]PIQ58217.1 MAG: MFS transporter [Bdellovibrio sp. CG12_big_fil_rev_8_21_14_0_65_39_13]PIR36626.1 MAG: MFS transporter [Bdellovibrio sp. CG11_big_fil_rev_8_21_14_0_20_39_38]
MNAPSQKKENPLINIFMNVVIPTLILTKFSKPEYLGQNLGFIIAIAFPVAYGVYDLILRKKYNIFSIIGFVSVLLTGGIGLLKLDGSWIVVKETSIPLLMGIIVIVMERFGKSFVKKIFMEVLDLEKIEKAYDEKNMAVDLQQSWKWASYGMGLSFLLSAILNYVLAKVVLTGAPGSVEFNESLGKMTALSFPVITIPTMIMFMIIMYRFFKNVKDVTNLEPEDLIRH